MYHQVVQLLTGAKLIARPQGASIKELMEHLEVSRKSVYRLFDALEELGYYLYPDKVGKEARYYLNREVDKMRYWQPLPATSLTVEERVFLEYMFKKIADNPALAKQAGTLRNKLSMAISDCGYAFADKNGRSKINSPSSSILINDMSIAKKASDKLESVMSSMLQAIREKKACEVSYESFSSGTIKTYLIHPLTMFEHNGGIYAYVFQPYYGKIIILALERIRELSVTDETFDIPEGYDAKQRLSDPFGIILKDTTFTARIRFDEDQAPYIRERVWPEGTVIEEGDDGAIILNVTTAGAYELKKWLLGFGSSAEILEPDWLRKECINELNDILNIYK